MTSGSKTFRYADGKLAGSESCFFASDGTLSERWLTDYDSNSRVLSTYGLKADGSPLGDGKYSYEYDEEGRKTKVWTFSEFAADPVAASVTIYEYVNDQLGNWIERQESYIVRDGAHRSKQLTTRTLTYFPLH